MPKRELNHTLTLAFMATPNYSLIVPHVPNVGPNVGTHSPLPIAVRVSLLCSQWLLHLSAIIPVAFPEANVFHLSAGSSRHTLWHRQLSPPSPWLNLSCCPAWDCDLTTAFRRLTSSVLTPRIRDRVSPAPNLRNIWLIPYCLVEWHY